MPHYFHGWKRKLGVLTLAMALFLAVGWCRSRYVTDSVAVVSAPWYPWIESVDGEIAMGTGFFEMQEFQHLTPWWHTQEFHSVKHRYFNSYRQCWLEWHGFGVGMGYGAWTRQCSTGLRPDYVYFIIPYWSIVLPLTLISAWLLLSKPPGRPKGLALPSA